MKFGPSIGRRRFLAGAAALSATSFAMGPSALLAQTGRFAVNVASNQGVENATLQQLILDRGYLNELSLDTTIVESRTVSGPMEALLSGAADICMISGFTGVIPAITKGKELRLVGAAMLLPALAVYSGQDGIRRIADLAGRTVGVGPTNGLLHGLMVALLRKKGIDPALVKFVNSGSNAQVFQAVASGKVDAGLSGLAGSANRQVRILEDGALWEELKEYTYQPAYASVRAIKEKPEALARCLAAYTKLYRFLSSPESRTPYLEARKKATKDDSSAEAEAVWSFIQKHKPYAVDVGLSPQRISYLQELNVTLGVQPRVLPFDQIADMSVAEGAKRFLA